ncbi:uncharacterized protein SCDLUD_002386 [Saccharomycodes ludwigii]|uniref:uncharacterized protein n=1 Tax=Saccharomycodes ludwigii TaxID=36035 RepID=UPI001E89A11B|nr:hypothetical protein SCDLUD_002386 [Saccharomycodes ludwigii]KAH3900926.1 hypothetical protein SCDLUD_002386 [Saccharomycodes ludwigii]
MFANNITTTSLFNRPNNNNNNNNNTNNNNNNNNNNTYSLMDKIKSRIIIPYVSSDKIKNGYKNGGFLFLKTKRLIANTKKKNPNSANNDKEINIFDVDVELKQKKIITKNDLIQYNIKKTGLIKKNDTVHISNGTAKNNVNGDANEHFNAHNTDRNVWLYDKYVF